MMVTRREEWAWRRRCKCRIYFSGGTRSPLPPPPPPRPPTRALPAASPEADTCRIEEQEPVPTRVRGRPAEAEPARGAVGERVSGGARPLSSDTHESLLGGEGERVPGRLPQLHQNVDQRFEHAGGIGDCGRGIPYGMPYGDPYDNPCGDRYGAPH